MGYSHRKGVRDANHTEIVNALRGAGFLVWEIERPCDLLVHSGMRHDRFKLVEIKNPEKRTAAGHIMGPRKNLRPDQRFLLDSGIADFAVVWTAEEAVSFCKQPNPQENENADPDRDVEQEAPEVKAGSSARD